jgi:hypothetical protein
MKRLVVLILLMINSAFGFGQTAEFFVDAALHKFPKTNEGVQLKHDFVVTNKGAVPLIISSYEVSCSCTKVILPPPIPPGKTGIVTVTFDTKDKYYQQDRKIILQTNTKKKVEYLRFKVFVVPLED